MDLDLFKTQDGSFTLFNKELKETYHSTHGAIQESEHVFIKSGFDLLGDKNEIYIFEMGFGTGLNAFLTCIKGQNNGQKINYFGLEKHPLSEVDYKKLNYQIEVNKEEHEINFLDFHYSPWEKTVELFSEFNLTKIKGDLESIELNIKVDLIYFDAFSPNTQAQLWTETIFRKMHNILNKNGILVTYSCKGDVKRAMKAAGFQIEKIPGPPGKREMLRGYSKPLDSSY